MITPKVTNICCLINICHPCDSVEILFGFIQTISKSFCFVFETRKVLIGATAYHSALVIRVFFAKKNLIHIISFKNHRIHLIWFRAISGYSTISKFRKKTVSTGDNFKTELIRENSRIIREFTVYK